MTLVCFCIFCGSVHLTSYCLPALHWNTAQLQDLTPTNLTGLTSRFLICLSAAKLCHCNQIQREHLQSHFPNAVHIVNKFAVPFYYLCIVTNSARGTENEKWQDNICMTFSEIVLYIFLKIWLDLYEYMNFLKKKQAMSWYDIWWYVILELFSC